ncbi:MAG: ArsR/SmtB family transcription factor [Pseudomonadota bacterium]
MARGHLDQTLLALADPTRREILQQLSAGEARVTDLARPFGMSLNAVSKHIQALEKARLVVRRRAGREHLLSFNPGPLDEVADWIADKRAFWNARLDALAQELGAPFPGEEPGPDAEPVNPESGATP